MPPGLLPLVGAQPFNFIWAVSDGHANGGPRLESYSLMQCEKDKDDFTTCWD